MVAKLQAVLTNLSYGIYVLTSRYGDKANGMIASWVSQVSHTPPLIMVAVHPHRYSHDLIEKGGAFALHILDRNQAAYLGRFKGPDPLAKFDALDWEEGRTGCPILVDCIGHVECRLNTKLAPGNHTLFIGEVLDARLNGEGQPLSTFDYDGVYTGER